MRKLIIEDINNENIGNKAKNLMILKQKNYNVIDSYIIDTKELENTDFDNYNLDLIDDTKLYAIRSSAIGEDGYKNSFAGIFKSNLNVKKNDFKDSLKDVYNSFYSRRAIVYSDLKKASYKPCILIQEMVHSDYSIVMFIVENKIVFNVAKGLCEQIVSGSCTAAEFVINIDDDFNKNIKIIDENIKKHYTFLNIEFLIKDILKLKEIFGDFLDIELAFNEKENKWYFLQIRHLIN